MTALLETRSVTKAFGGLTAVSGVDLAIATGDLHCLIGPNGAGKSTLFKLIVGQHAASAGAIVFDGEDITDALPFARVQRGISMKMQAPNIFKNLSTRQNLHIALQRRATPRQVLLEEERLLEL
jgi:branched-chain amino acid transport system ATP-binding protein